MLLQKIILTPICLLILLIGSAQNSINQFDSNGKRHGIWTKNYHNTDQVRYMGVFDHGKEIDTFKYFKLSNGKSVLSATKVFNRNDSLADVKFYASNQNLISEGKMKGKKFIGKWLYYHKNTSNKMIEEYFNNEGELEGERKVYYKNGEVAEHALYENGKLEGEAKWYAANGKLIKVANFLDGEFHGKYVTYNLEGEITSEGTYDKDRKVGIWMYNEEGKKPKTIDYSAKTKNKQ